MKFVLTVFLFLCSCVPLPAEVVQVLLVADAPAGLVRFQTSTGENWELNAASNSVAAYWGSINVSNEVSALLSSGSGYQFTPDILAASSGGQITFVLSSASAASLNDVFSEVLHSLTGAVVWLAILFSVAVGALLFRFVSLRSTL